MLEREESFVVQKEDVDRFRLFWKRFASNSLEEVDELHRKYRREGSVSNRLVRCWQWCRGGRGDTVAAPENEDDATMDLISLQRFIAKLGPPLGPSFNESNAEDFTGKRNEEDEAAVLNATPSQPTSILQLQSSSSRWNKLKVHAASYSRVLAFLKQLNIPLCGNRVQQVDVFMCLMETFYGVALPAEVNRALEALAKNRFEVLQFVRHHDAGKKSSEGGLKLAVCAAMIQSKWRQRKMCRIVEQVRLQKKIHVEQNREQEKWKAVAKLMARPIGQQLI